MICRILDIKEPLNATLGQKNKAELVLSANDLERLQAVAKLMVKFKTFATMLGGEYYAAISYLKVMVVQ